MNMETRYMMNSGVLTDKEMKSLSEKSVLVVGIGGLGGNVCNQLVRLGVCHLTLVDFDCFSESNLNRQLFSNVSNIGAPKVDVLKDNLLLINPKIDITIHQEKIQDVELDSVDYIIDCVDNIETKLYLSQLSAKLEIPLLHGSCGGWYGQVGWLSPKSELLEEIYSNGEGLEKELLNPVFAPSVVSSFMVSEFVKMIKSSTTIMYNELLLIDLYNNALMKTGR